MKWQHEKGVNFDTDFVPKLDVVKGSSILDLPLTSLRKKKGICLKEVSFLNIIILHLSVILHSLGTLLSLYEAKKCYIFI